MELIQGYTWNTTFLNCFNPFVTSLKLLVHRERASSSPDSSHFLGLHLEFPHKTTSSSCGGGCASVWPHRKYAHRENTLAGTGEILRLAHRENTDVGKTLMNLATLDTYTIGA